MEDALSENPWFAGASYSLADIGLVPYVNRLDMMSMSAMWTRSRPKVTDWFERIKARPTFKVQLIDWVPADLTIDMRAASDAHRKNGGGGYRPADSKRSPNAAKLALQIDVTHENRTVPCAPWLKRAGGPEAVAAEGFAPSSCRAGQGMTAWR